MELWAGIALLLGIAAIVAPMTPGLSNPFVVAGIWLAFVVYGTALIGNNWIKVNAALASYPRAASLVAGAFGFLAIAGVFYTYVVPKAVKVAKTAIVKPGAADPPPSGEAATQTLLARFRPSKLPIALASGSRMYALGLHPDIPEGVHEITNKDKDPRSWPDESLGIKVSGDKTAEHIHLAELTNHDQRTILRVSIAFSMSFHQPVQVPSITRTLPNGALEVFVPRKDLESSEFSYATEDQKFFTIGGQLKQLTREIALPAIAPNETVTLFLVNQSSYIVKFIYPDESTGVVVGNPHPVRIALIRPNLYPNDKYGYFWLPPTGYKWKGVPNLIGRSQP